MESGEPVVETRIEGEPEQEAVQRYGNPRGVPDDGEQGYQREKSDRTEPPVAEEARECKRINQCSSDKQEDFEPVGPKAPFTI